MSILEQVKQEILKENPEMSVTEVEKLAKQFCGVLTTVSKNVDICHSSKEKPKK